MLFSAQKTAFSMYSHLNLTKRLTYTLMELPKKGLESIPPYRLCKLYHFNYDTSKTWLLEFYQWNIVSQELERRFFSRFNRSKDSKERLKEAQRWERFINQQLENGAVYNGSRAKVGGKLGIKFGQSEQKESNVSDSSG
ncbi:hypothetical protein GCM10027347_22560 [Larkinella harenae]